MSDIDWSKAPNWANVLLKHVRDDSYVWAESLSDESKAQHAKEKCFTFTLIKACWLAVAYRPVIQQWNGAGLPPVGVVCEMQDDVGVWIKAEIIAMHAGFAHGWHESTQSSFYSDKPEEFRPIRTPEQIADDEREAAIKEMTANYAEHFDKLAGWAAYVYDTLGYRKP